MLLERCANHATFQKAEGRNSSQTKETGSAGVSCAPQILASIETESLHSCLEYRLDHPDT